MQLNEDIEAPAIVVLEFVTHSKDLFSFAPVDPSSVKVGEAHLDDVGSVTVARNSGCISEVMIKGGMGATILTPMSAILSSRATVVLTRSRLEDSTHQRNLLVDQNQFAPFSIMGNEMGFCFGVSDDLSEISTVEGHQWCDPLEG